MFHEWLDRRAGNIELIWIFEAIIRRLLVHLDIVLVDAYGFLLQILLVFHLCFFHFEVRVHLGGDDASPQEPLQLQLSLLLRFVLFFAIKLRLGLGWLVSGRGVLCLLARITMVLVVVASFLAALSIL